jgi:hypothetical protein
MVMGMDSLDYSSSLADNPTPAPPHSFRHLRRLGAQFSCFLFEGQSKQVRVEGMASQSRLTVVIQRARGHLKSCANYSHNQGVSCSALRSQPEKTLVAPWILRLDMVLRNCMSRTTPKMFYLSKIPPREFRQRADGSLFSWPFMDSMGMRLTHGLTSRAK